MQTWQAAYPHRYWPCGIPPPRSTNVDHLGCLNLSLWFLSRHIETFRARPNLGSFVDMIRVWLNNHWNAH